MSAKTQPLDDRRGRDLVQHCGNPAAKAEKCDDRLHEPVAPGAFAQLLGQLVRKQSAGHCGGEAHHGCDSSIRARSVRQVTPIGVLLVDQFPSRPVVGLLGVPVCQQLEVRRFEIL